MRFDGLSDDMSDGGLEGDLKRDGNNGMGHSC